MMSHIDEGSASGANHLLNILPPDELQRLSPQLETVSLEAGRVLYEPYLSIRHVYFPRTAVVSLLVETPGGRQVEVATVGNEGLVGLPGALGSETSTVTALAQIPGRADRIGVEPFRAAIRDSRFWRELLDRYVVAILSHISQSTACNSVHTVRQRFCRWLLVCHDRTTGNTLPLTQHFLSIMLCVRRATISEVSRTLQDSGLIASRRGLVTILDRDGLENASCECYGVLKKVYDRLLPSSPG